MKPLIAIASLVALSACVDPTAPQPQYNPAMAKVRQACDAGDVEACKVIVQAQQRPAPAPYPPVQIIQPLAPMPPMRGTSQTTVRCQPGFYGTGQVTCTTY